MSVQLLPALDTAFALSPISPLPTSIMVSRLEAEAPTVECALCWGGPIRAAAIVRERSAEPNSGRLICSRCLVTLEMLAAQFGAELRLTVEGAP